jgi:8-oxo-dGTP pyrophosphatase MutT (NUDIX family)
MPAEAVPAATVILLRDATPSPEVLMLERHSSSEFLPDMYVFPGGRVEEQDGALAGRLSGVDPEELRVRLPQLERESALAFYVAAIRETFEESGIVLARARGDDALVSPERATELSRHRLEVQSGEHPFADLVEREKLELAADRLALHAHWITPEMVPRRFDTLFFTAVAPKGQLAGHDGVEATDHVWIRPEAALERLAARELRIILPTAANLRTLVGFATAQETLESSRHRAIVPVTPRIAERDGRRVLEIPPEAGYEITREMLQEGPTPR